MSKVTYNTSKLTTHTSKTTQSATS